MHVENLEKSSLAAPETQTLLDSLMWLRMWMLIKSSPQASRCMNEGVVLLVMGAAPALAKDTTGIKLAGKAEKAAATKSEALISIAQNKAVCRHEVEMPPQKGK
jgi:hypothetical protein